jgi:hypothetical protein
VKDRTSMVMETNKIFTKQSLIQQAHNKCIVVKRILNFSLISLIINANGFTYFLEQKRGNFDF